MRRDERQRSVVVAGGGGAELLRPRGEDAVERLELVALGNRARGGLTFDELDAARGAAGVAATRVENVDVQIFLNGENKALACGDFNGPETFNGELGHV